MTTTAFTPIPEAIEAIANGKMILLVDDERRENEGDLVIAADFISDEAVNFMITEGRGLLCMPMSSDRMDKLGIPNMVTRNDSRHGTAFGVSVGAAQGITTGISAKDRAETIRVAANPESTPNDLVMPGHIFPLRAKAGGVIERAGHTEASVDLMTLAGLNPVAAICEVIKPDGTMARLPELEAMASEHDLPLVCIQDLITYRLRNSMFLEPLTTANLPISNIGQFTMHVFKHSLLGSEHIALVAGTRSEQDPTTVRLHSECLTGDVFGSARCDCGRQLHQSLDVIARTGGVLLYLRQEGRGIGLANKIKAYALQDEGLDTVEANHRLGFDADQRDYGMASQLLKALGIHQVALLTNNPEKVKGLEKYGIHVSQRLPVEIIPDDNNLKYLTTKRDKLGHWLNFDKDGE